MPPLMGAGAFVMVELTSTPYTDIMAAAILPAMLFFVAVWFGVDGFANRYDLKGMGDEARVPVKTLVLITRPVLHGAVCGAAGAECSLAEIHAQYAAAWPFWHRCCLAVFQLLPACASCKEIRSALESRHHHRSAARVAVIASIILCASIIVGVLGQTGLGVKITSLILDRVWRVAVAALLLTALACLILGMEVPTTAAYVICVSVAGPALIAAIGPCAACRRHTCLCSGSRCCRPSRRQVCGTVFIAAGMIGENWLKVAFTAMALGIGLYVIPLAMIANPSVIALSEAPTFALLAAAKIGLGLALISFGVIGFTKPLQKVLAIGSGLLVVFLAGV
jgi:TRAP-type uncharacterized transport system fused permease subunit